MYQKTYISQSVRDDLMRTWRISNNYNTMSWLISRSLCPSNLSKIAVKNAVKLVSENIYFSYMYVRDDLLRTNTIQCHGSSRDHCVHSTVHLFISYRCDFWQIQCHAIYDDWITLFDNLKSIWTIYLQIKIVSFLYTEHLSGAQLGNFERRAQVYL